MNRVRWNRYLWIQGMCFVLWLMPGQGLAQSNGVQPSKPALLVGAFNIQIFGKSKMSKPEVAQTLVAILRRYDLVLIQEIRDQSGDAILQLLKALNTVQEEPYLLILSERLGRTSSKEQYGFLYKPNKLEPLDQFAYEDGPEPNEDTFQY